MSISFVIRKQTFNITSTHCSREAKEHIGTGKYGLGHRKVWIMELKVVHNEMYEQLHVLQVSSNYPNKRAPRTNSALGHHCPCNQSHTTCISDDKKIFTHLFQILLASFNHCCIMHFVSKSSRDHHHHHMTRCLWCIRVRIVKKYLKTLHRTKARIKLWCDIVKRPHAHPFSFFFFIPTI